MATYEECIVVARRILDDKSMSMTKRIERAETALRDTGWPLVRLDLESMRRAEEAEDALNAERQEERDLKSE